jgi:molybdopterin converting factor small subunit
MSLFNKLDRKFGKPVDPKKKIGTFVTDKKTEVESLRQYNKDFAIANDTLKDWAKINGEDISCTIESIVELNVEARKLLDNYIKSLNTQIGEFKEIKASEKNLKVLKANLKDLSQKLDENFVKEKNTLEIVEENYSKAKKEYELKSNEHDAFVRERLRRSYVDQFDALKELAQKLDIIATFGKHAANQIPLGFIPVDSEKPEFKGQETLKEIVTDAKEALNLLNNY